MRRFDRPGRTFVDGTGTTNTRELSIYDYVILDSDTLFGGDENYVDCSMISKAAMRDVTVASGQVMGLTYDTVDGLHHVGAQAAIFSMDQVDSTCGGQTVPCCSPATDQKLLPLNGCVLCRRDECDQPGTMRIDIPPPGGRL